MMGLKQFQDILDEDIDMSWITNWIKGLAHALHHLFNPHCEKCESLLAQKQQFEREHALELRVCQSCEALKTQLEFQNLLIKELTRRPEPESNASTENLKPIVPKHIPWAVRRAQLEKEDRELASRLRMEKQREVTADNLDEELESLGNK